MAAGGADGARAPEGGVVVTALALDAQALTIAFGGLKAVTGLTLQVPVGALHGLKIGRAHV